MPPSQHLFFPLPRVLVIFSLFFSSPSYLLLTVICLFVRTEILDFGYPQNSETGALKTFITQQGIKGQVSDTSVASHLLITFNCVLKNKKDKQSDAILIGTHKTNAAIQHPCNKSYVHEVYHVQFLLKLLQKCWFNFMIILEAAVYDAVELYHVTLRGVFISFFILFTVINEDKLDISNTSHRSCNKEVVLWGFAWSGLGGSRHFSRMTSIIHNLIYFHSFVYCYTLHCEHQLSNTLSITLTAP